MVNVEADCSRAKGGSSNVVRARSGRLVGMTKLWAVGCWLEAGMILNILGRH